VTLLSVVPAQLAQLLDRSPVWNPPAFVRAILVGGAPTPAALLNQAADRGWPVLTTYGLTEACSQVATQRPGTVNRGDLGSGRPLPGIEVRIVDGSIQVRGRTLFARYLPAGGAPLDAEGWFTTGDEGRLDDAGNLHVLGRRDDAIITGGEKVLPHEVEEALRSCPGVADACVLGAPDPTWGQIVSALIVPREAPPPTAALAHELARLAPYKRPRRLAFATALPMSPSGKLDRRAAAALCAATAQPFVTS
jgi:O-succinylbenzoic acid--CoA ligase